MRIQISRISVDESAIDPRLLLDIAIIYYSQIESPFSVAAQLVINSTHLAIFQECSIITENYDTINLRRPEGSASEKTETNRSARLVAQLSQKAIDFIETHREKRPDKSVEFQVEFIVRLLRNSDDRAELEIASKKFHEYYRIEQSRWIKDYAERLGIGKYLLLELKVLGHELQEKLWRDLYDTLVKNLADAERCLKSGEWEDTMLYMRRFYENIKIGDKRPGNIQFEKAFTRILKDENHGDKGIENFYNAIWQFFEFNSKYIHNKATDGNIVPIPNAQKEDAFLAYSLGIGLLNFIGRKISRNGR